MLILILGVQIWWAWRGFALLSSRIPWSWPRRETDLYWEAWKSWVKQAYVHHYIRALPEVSCARIWKGIAWKIPCMFNCCKETHWLDDNNSWCEWSGMWTCKIICQSLLNSLVFQSYHFIFFHHHCLWLLCLLKITGF